MQETVLNLFRGVRVVSVTLESFGIILQLTTSRLWVDSPWRLEEDGAILLGSGNLEEYRSHEDYTGDYEEAVEEIGRLVAGNITDAECNDFQELRLRFENGILLRTFQNYGPDAENFQLTVEEGRYLVAHDSIEFEPKRDQGS